MQPGTLKQDALRPSARAHMTPAVCQVCLPLLREYVFVISFLGDFLVISHYCYSKSNSLGVSDV